MRPREPVELNARPAIHPPGWGIDADHHRRPGVPAELNPPRPSGTPPYDTPAQQASLPAPLVGPERRLTPVYSTAAPPGG